MELGHLLTRSGLTDPEVSSKAYHDSFCQLGSSISLPWVIYFQTFCLHVVSSFSCIPVICPNLVLFLTPLQFVHLFCNLSQCILLFSCISSRCCYCCTNYLNCLVHQNNPSPPTAFWKHDSSCVGGDKMFYLQINSFTLAQNARCVPNIPGAPSLGKLNTSSK